MKNTMMDTQYNNVVTGKDGEIWVSTDGTNFVLIGEAESFSAEMNVTTSDVQPLGSLLIYGAETGVSFTISMSEIVIRDDLMMKELTQNLYYNDHILPQFNLRAKLSHKDGTFHEQVFRDCKPDGTVNLISLTPGEVVKRPWTFRVNAFPEVSKYFFEPVQ